MGVLFAAILGPAGWIAMGAAAGGLFASFDRGIKNKILRELGDGMTSSESALALLVERADWQTAMERMRSHGFGGELVVSEITPEDMAAIEKVLADPTTAEAVPEEMDVPAPIDEPAVAPVAAAVVATSADGTGPAPTKGSPGHVRIEEVEGIEADDAAKLVAAGVKTTDDLLMAGALPAGRARVAAATGISPAAILGWVNKADLMRIPGVGAQYSDLLEAAGVDSPAELVQRNPANLATTFDEVVAARPGIVHRTPSEAEVSGWIKDAKDLPKLVEH
jgi:predicted flap endonuclease-1-like 5' DNA nuclease